MATTGLRIAAMFMLRVGWGRTQDATFTENFTDEPDYFAHSSYESADRGARADGRVAPDRALTDAPPGRCKPLYGERGRASRRAATGLRTTANEAPAFNSSATKMISRQDVKMIDARGSSRGSCSSAERKWSDGGCW